LVHSEPVASARLKDQKKSCIDLSGKITPWSPTPNNCSMDVVLIVAIIRNARSFYCRRKKNGKDCFVFEKSDLK